MTESDQEWIYVVGGQRHGPLSAREIATLISGDRLAAHTLVWKPGMSEWRSACDVHEIAGYCPPPLPDAIARVRQNVAAARSDPGAGPAPSPPTPHPQHGSRPAPSNSFSQAIDGGHHPWRRYFARLFDTCMVWLPTYVFLAVVVDAVLPQATRVFRAVLRQAGLLDDAATQRTAHDMVALFLVFLVGILLEALMLPTFGTTPGKWLFGISVRGGGGRNLTFGQGAARALGVSIQGLGFGLPLVSLCTLYYAYRRLEDTGTTLWDTAVGSKVSHVPWGPWRWVFAVLATMIVLLLLSVLGQEFSRAR